MQKRETTRKLFITGFIVCTFKLLTSDLSIGTLKLGSFSGVDFAAAIGALGAIYAARRHTDAITKSKE